MKLRVLLFILITFNLTGFGQTKFQEKPIGAAYRITWQKPLTVKYSDSKVNHFISFKGAQYCSEDGILPRYSQKIKLANGQTFTAEVINAAYETLTDDEISLVKDFKKINNQISVKTTVSISRKQSYGILSFIPIRKNSLTGRLEKLVSFDLNINTTSSEKSNTRNRTYAAHSILQSGKWYKIAIASDGIYKLSYPFLQSLGIDMATLNPANIRVYGNGGGMLPELNSIARPDDLLENAISVQTAVPGVFGTSDYVLFYGKGPNTWSFNNSSVPKFQHTLNLYSDSAYYFINTDLGAGKRIPSQASSSSSLVPANNIVTSFDDYGFHELDAVNFIQSGREWYGEYFDNIASYNFSFPFPNIDVTSVATVKANIASRDIAETAYYSISSQSGITYDTIQSTPQGDPYAFTNSGSFAFLPSTSPVITVNVTKQTSDAVAWLDYIEVNARRELSMVGNQMIFRDSKSAGVGNVAQFNVSSSTPILIWDVTDPANVMLQNTNTVGNSYQFVLPTDNMRQFVAYINSPVSFLSPTFIGTVANQDLHSLTNKDFIIVTHPDFYQQALQLASYHETRDSIYANVVTTQQIFNEFSSGAQDISAIRDFVKMFYDRAGSNTSLIPKYLLLFGDGSYDNKHRFSNNSDFIPTYESYNSTLSTGSYVSDDFYGCLDNSEGGMVDGVDAVDIGIGRFPTQTQSDANTAINKILSYKRIGVQPTTAATNSCSNPSLGSPFGDWRNMLCFIADDEDGDLHISQANALATMVDTTDNKYNIDKIYLDSYIQVATPGGDRYPAVNDAINQRIAKGCLIMNYTGHGGVVGLAHERIVDITQISSWTNINNMPLFFTATCEFSRWDDPERISAGEYMFLNPNGASIALFTTVRETYAGPNFNLNMSFYNDVFTPINGKMPRLGDIYEYIKNTPDGDGLNGRNFALLGDPALTLCYPEYNVSTDSINSHLVTSSISDTLKALATITVSGYVRDKNNTVLNNYSGVMYPTVYDKPQNITTLSNDGVIASPPFTFTLQKNILFKGKVSVYRGHFRFTFIVPKDITYQYGLGRISYYAENGTDDASGYYEKAYIGGTSNSHVTDVTGPDAKLYLNDDKFVFGGLTNENPDLYSILKDESGINTIGNGIGHDITAILDGNTGNSIVLNDYYQSDLNSYKSGSVRYPFSSLSEGNHTLKLKVWDVYNNSSEVYTEFVVSSSANLALNHVLNYPNPFTTKTQFYFEDNQCCQQLDVQIQIFTISGKIVKTIDRLVYAEGFRSDPIDWDGRDDFGDKIGRGVYIYRVKIKTGLGSTAEKYEKLVILN